MIQTITKCSFVIAIVLAVENCDKHGINIYEDMKCKILLYENGCPSKYDCQNLLKSKHICHYKGNKYEEGKHFNNSLTFCKFGCFCRQKTKETAGFLCADFSCRSWDTPARRNCYWTYKLGDCCGIDQNCPSKDSEVFKCDYQGKKYREGEKFFPVDSCTECLCQDGFKGKIEEPFCRRTQCDVEITFQSEIQKSCAPVFYMSNGNGLPCCPNIFICPDGNEVVSGTPISDDQCRFGETALKVGQEIIKDIKDVHTRTVHCKCQIPPLLTCTTYEYK